MAWKSSVLSQIWGIVQGVLLLGLFLTANIWLEALSPLFIELFQIVATHVLEPVVGSTSDLTWEEKRRLVELLPYLMVAFVVIAFVVVITISNRRSFFAWVSDNPGFNDWLRKNGHSVPLNFKKLGYAESQRKYEEYLAFQKQENDVQIASERGLLSGVSTPSFLALSRREIAFRILLAGFFLFPFVATYAFSVFGIFDNQEQSNIIMMGMFGFLPVLVLTGIDLRGITDSSSKIRHFRNLVRSPRFLKWCQKRGYSVNANTERGIFSEWAEEFDAVWEKENREFEMWLKDRKYDLESWEYDEERLAEIEEEFRNSMVFPRKGA